MKINAKERFGSYITRNNCYGLPLAFVFFSILSFVSNGLNAQDEIRFTAFGYTPRTIPDSVYSKLKKETNIVKKLHLLYEIGKMHNEFGYADSTVFYSKQIEAIILPAKEKLKNYDQYLIWSKRLLGDGKYGYGYYEEALKAYIDGINIGSTITDNAERKWLELGLGKVYLQKGDHEKARALFMTSAQTERDNELKVQANYCLGVLALRQEDEAKATSFFKKAKAVTSDGINKKTLLKIEFYEGIIAWRKKDNNTALNIFEEVMNRSLENNYYDTYTEAVSAYGTIYRELGEYEAAEMSLSMAYANAMNWNRLELQKKIINGLRLTYVAKGDYKNAYNLMTQYLQISSEISEQQNTKVIKELEFKYETLQKEKEIYELKETQQAKQNEIERQKTIKKAFLYGFLALLVPILALLYVYYQKLQTQSQLNTQQEELNNQKIASLLSEQELKLARAALDAQQEERARIAQQLHDSIGGNLAGIKLRMSNMVNTDASQQDIIHQVDDTYELVRSISHDLIPKKFNESAFTLLIREYLQNIKRHSDLSITFLSHPEEKINGLKESVKVEIYQIIQELFTNSLKHADAKNIELHLTIYETILQLLFEDDGVGFEMDRTEVGIGLSNIKNRVEQLGGETIIDSTIGRGTAITIEIPLKEKYEKV
ncbi:ATP-binding protein [Maribacter sp. 2210JD10-5]|uniref:tetratricopeptide repeat-containing sensor histidine kinase n=1 Tax=Maribacter sp. 2210JD10-5 TaxID=3386272 RepID=UPI0039BD0C64